MTSKAGHKLDIHGCKVILDKDLAEFLQRWHDVPPPTPPVELSPKRFNFSQPISELRPNSPAQPAAPPPQPQPQPPNPGGG